MSRDDVSRGEVSRDDVSRQEDTDDRPPFGGRWFYLYAGVLLFLLLQVVIYTVFTRAWA